MIIKTISVTVEVDGEEYGFRDAEFSLPIPNVDEVFWWETGSPIHTSIQLRLVKREIRYQDRVVYIILECARVE